MSKQQLMMQLLFDAEALGIDAVCNTSEWNELDVNEQMQIQSILS